MSRKPKFPPSILTKRGYNYCRIKGKDIYLGKVGSPDVQKEYRLLLDRLAPETAPDLVQRKDFTVGEMLLLYDRAAKQDQDWRQLKRIKYALGPVLEKYHSTLALEFTPLALEDCRSEFVKRGYSRKYINELVTLIRQAWKWASVRQLVPSPVYHALKDLPGLSVRANVPDRKPVELVPEEVVERTIPLLFPEVQAMVRLQLLTGMRPGEVIIMKPEDIDQKGIVARNGETVWVYSPGKHKNRWRNKPRQIPLGPKAQAILKTYLERLPGSYCFNPREIVARRWEELNRSRRRPSEREPGLHYTAMSYCRNIARVIKKFNLDEEEQARLEGRLANPIPSWSPRQIRKTVATAISDIDLASCVLGHEKPDTTAIFYRSKLLRAAEWSSEAG